jgi:hypothetical protein
MAISDDEQQQRLDRIEGYIKQMTEVSARLQQELNLSRRLAEERARATQPHASAGPKRRQGRKGR